MRALAKALEVKDSGCPGMPKALRVITKKAQSSALHVYFRYAGLELVWYKESGENWKVCSRVRTSKENTVKTQSKCTFSVTTSRQRLTGAEQLCTALTVHISGQLVWTNTLVETLCLTAQVTCVCIFGRTRQTHLWKSMKQDSEVVKYLCSGVKHVRTVWISCIGVKIMKTSVWQEQVDTTQLLLHD